MCIEIIFHLLRVAIKIMFGTWKAELRNIIPNLKIEYSNDSPIMEND
jgi:hypothetical protein